MQQLPLWQGLARPQSVQVMVSAEPPTPATAEAGATFQAAQDPAAVAAWLCGELGQGVRLTLTRNRITMVSFRVDGTVVHVRLHAMFLQAGAPQMAALVAFIRGRRGARQRLDAFVEAHEHLLDGPTPPLRPQGQVHDLAALLSYNNRAYFHDACRAGITWARARRVGKHKKQRRGRLLSAYARTRRLISIDPCLDQSFVPTFFVSFVVFCEMVYELYDADHTGKGHGRRRLRAEVELIVGSHPDCRRALQWQQTHASELQHLPLRGMLTRSDSHKT